MKKKTSALKEVNTTGFIELLKEYEIKVSKTEASSRKFLIDLGVLTNKGNFRKHYRNICIPGGLD